MALLIDTDVSIDYLRDYPQAVQFLEDDRREMLISAVSVAELYAGVREGAEREAAEIPAQLRRLPAAAAVTAYKQVAANLSAVNGTV